jgi:amino acid adenylation domain-containing protein
LANESWLWKDTSEWDSEAMKNGFNNENRSQTAGVSESLSAQQRRFWVLEQLEQATSSHCVPISLRIRGALDVPRLEEATRLVHARHDVLRSRIVMEKDEPRIVFSLPTRAPFALIDLTSLPEKDREQSAFVLLAKDLNQAFDLQAGPLSRATLYRLGNDEHLYVLSLHRIVCDWESAVILSKEVAAAYSSVVADAPLLPSGAQYGDYWRSQNDYLQSETSAADLAYWKDKLANAPNGLELGTDHPRRVSPSLRGAEQHTLFSGDLLNAVKAFSEREGSSVFVTLLAAFSCLLGRYTGAEDIVIGTELSGRTNPSLAQAVGALSNQVVLRTSYSGEANFREMVKRVSQVWTEAEEHQELPFGTLLEELNVPRDISRNPLFQVSVSQRMAAEPFDAGGLHWEPARVATRGEILDLRVEIVERDQGVEARFFYSTDLFEHATIERAIGHFRTVVESAIQNPEEPVSRLQMLTAAEPHQLLVEWNDAEVPYPPVECLHEFFEEQVERTPDAVAVTHHGQSLRYRELNSRANSLAHYLRKQGVGPDMLVGICVERSLEMLVGILGILKAGGAYVPLDPAYPKDRLAVILEDAKARILLTQERLTELLPQTARLVRLDSDWPEIAQNPATNPQRNVTRDNLDYVLFTSGSTGRPKGVALEHRSGVIFVHWARQVFLPEELKGTLLSTSICFDLSVFEMFVPLSVGGTVIIAQNALELPDLPAAHDVTLINTVPSAIAALIRMAGVPPSVRVVNLAGEALLTTLAQQIYQETNVDKVYNLYGPTEDTTYSTYTLVPRGGEVTIGKPLLNTQAYIVDKNLQPVPIGVPGELFLAGDGLARGYFGRDDLTNERFVPNPFSSVPGARMYRTGDLCRFLANGEIEYLGRIDNQVKIRGFRIELEEIETVLSRHPSVESAVVIAREDIPGDKRLVAYVVPSGKSISAAVLQDAIRAQLPEYMVPSAIVELQRLPLSPNGKINRRLLQAPDTSALERSSLVEPRDELEVTLLKIWQKVLGANKIGMRDDFFDLGGHSLMGARVLVEVERVTGKKLPLSSLFRGGTIELLARLIREHDEAGDPVLLKIQEGESSRLPFFAIVPPGEESLGYAMLARHMGPEQTVYKVQGQSPVTGGKRPYSEQEMLALRDEYVAAMRSVQRRGPYCLGGLCDGTHIAEQIVHKLESEGEEVALFAIFDTWVLQHSQNRFLWKIHYYSQRVRQIGNLSLAERLASYKRVAENKVKNLAGSKAARTDWRQTYWPEDFTPARFRAPVVLFKRPKQPFYYVNDPQMGWAERSEGGVTIHEVEFHHAEILREPHVKVFGEKLAEHMAELTASISMDEDASLAGSVPGRQGA